MSLLAVAVAAPLLAMGGRRWWRRRVDRTERRRAARDLPGAVSDLARSVRSGATLEVAVREVAVNAGGALGRELRGAVSLLDRGLGIDRVLDLWRRATVLDGVDLVVAACRFSSRHGTGPAQALDGVGAALVDRIEVDDEVMALAAQARTSVAVLVMLPPVGAAIFGLVEPAFSDVLTGTTAGRVCLVAGLALDLLGVAVSRLLVRRAVTGAGERTSVGLPLVGRTSRSARRRGRAR